MTKLRQDLTKRGFDAILFSSIPNIIYLTNYSGFSKEEREVYLFVTKNQQYILTDGRYTQAAKTLISDFKLIEISPKNSAEKILKKLKDKHKIKKLGIEENDLKVNEYKNLKKHHKNTCHYGDICTLRSVKDKDEISKIENACKIADKTFAYILKKIKTGVSEKEIAQEIEFFIKRQGADISFSPIVAYGINSALPHHQPGNKRLTINDKIVLLDFGAKLDNYCSDMTRTVFFGKPTNEQKNMYQTVFEAQRKAIEYIANHHNDTHHRENKKTARNLKAKDVDKIARDYIISKGYPAIPHSLGHGVGLEIHESPRLSSSSKDILKEGMVFSIEPGIYLPAEASAKVGISNFGGIRIEDLVVLEKSGPRLLTYSKKGLIEL